MTKKIYRTAQGKTVDLGALQLQNENTRAVGNMGVNARGDIIDSLNRPIATRNDQVAKRYNRQTTNVSDTPVMTRKRQQQQAEQVPLPPEDFDDDFAREPAPAVEPAGTGLAAAIARARQIRQTLIEPTLPPADQSTIKKI